MDIIALGVLTLAGYEMTKQTKKKINKAPKIIETKEEEPSFLDGSQTHLNQKQFYSGSQAPGVNMSSGKINIFTGSNLMEHGNRNCRPEPTSMFNPQSGNTHIHGAPNVDTSERYTASNKMHNVLPFEQKRVGPGMNVTSDVTAKGGFHQYFRVLPQNVGEYKKNNFNQRMIPGKIAVSKRADTPDVEAPKYDSYYEYEDRTPLQTKSDFTASTVRSNIQCKPICAAVQPECYFGQAQSTTTSNSTSKDTRVHDATTQGFGGNVSMPMRAPTHAISGYIVNESDRELCSDNTRNAASQLEGTYVWDADNKLDPNNRSSTYTNEVGQAHGNTYTTYAKASTDTARMTAREGSTSNYEGVAHGYERKTETRDYNVNNTQRESTSHNYTAPSKHYSSGATVQTVPEQYTMKEESLVGYSPGPQGISIPLDSSVFCMETKNDMTSETRVNVSKMMSSNNISNAQQLGRMEHAMKIPVENNRNTDDFLSVANIVLQDNPFAMRLN